MNTYIKSFILWFLIALPSVCFGFHEVSPPDIMKACMGDTVSLPLNLTYDEVPPLPIDAFQFDVAYPTELLTFIGIDTSGSLTGGWTFMDGIENTPGVITLGGYSYPGQITTSGVLVFVTFSVDTTGGPLPVSVSGFTDDLAGATTTDGLLQTGVNDVSPPGMLKGCVGNTVTLPLILTYDGCPPEPIDAFQFDVTYPTTLFTFVGVDTTGSLTSGWTFMDGVENTPGVITLGGYSYPGQISSSGVLVNVIFSVTAEGGPLPVSLSQFTDDLARARTTAGLFKTSANDVSPPELTEGCPGDTVSLPLTLTYDGCPPQPIDAFQFDLTFPTTLLSFIEVDPSGSLTEGWTFIDGTENTPGVITLGGYNYPGQISTSGILVYINFKVTASGGPLPVSLDQFIDDLVGSRSTAGAFTGESDVDGDETCDDDDNCPNTANADQLDSDQDGAGDVCDVCPNDPDDDIDGDGVCGDVDNCPDVANTGQEDGDGDGTGDVCDACTDTDGDGYGNPGYPANTCTEDNCPYVSNPGQEDEDGDGIGDVCDICTDTDGDGYGNPGYPVNICSDDNCPDEANAGQENADNDGFGDICDICPYDPDNDIDNDGVCGDVDNCPEKANTNQKDSDSDGVGDMCDNCLVVPNPGQEDADGDGIGDVCDGPELIITMDAEYSRENGEKRKGDCILGGSGVVGPGDVLVIKVLVENVGYSEATGASYYSDSFEYLSLVVGSVTTTEGSVMQGNTPGDAAVEVDVGTIPGGGTVEITYQVAIDDPLPPDVTVIIHQGTVNSNEFGSTLAECIHTFDGIVRIYIGEPIVSVFISPELSIVKPDSQFQVCIEVDSATAEMWINSVYALITFNSILLDSVKVPTFEGTLLDSSGWDMKWHYYPGPTDTLELWLIGGGVGNTGVTGSGPIVCWEFRVRDDIYGTMPGDTTSIRFSKFWFNEGQPMSETENGFFMVNREPEFVTLLPDTIHIAEMHELCLDIEAVDPDPDSMFLWLELDPYPCDGAQPDTAAAGPGEGSVGLTWCWTPPKMGACDTLACSLFVKSTMPDSLMDTLTTVIVVDDCELLVSWPDTTGYPCGWIEIPVRVHPDYDCLADLDVVSAYFELDYDTDLLTVGEVGNEGLMTEHWGALIHNLDEENGKIYVALAGNYPLPQCDPICTWYDFLYVGFQVNAGVTSEDSAALSVDYVKFNEGDPMACWIDTTWLYFREFSITGKVYYSDPPYLPVPGVSIFKGGICDEGTFEILTDETGAFGITPLDECAGLCVWPEMENTLTVQDQIVTSYDATMILRMICGSQILSHNDSLAGDVTANGTISAFDASAILKWVVTGHIGSDLIPSHFIGDWIFESDLNCDITGFKDPCVCFPSFVEDVDLCWEAVITGDVSQNWPGSPAKVAVGELDAEVVDKTLQVNVGSARAVDMVISGADLKITDVLVEGLVEWAEDGEGLHVAAASETELGMITIIFERLVPGRLDVVARIDEDKVLSSVVKVVPIPTEYSLAQNYPNPFNPVTTIEYALPEASIVRLEVFNLLGQKVTELVNTKKESGYYRASWNSDKVTSGIYFYRMTAGDFIATKRMVLMK